MDLGPKVEKLSAEAARIASRPKTSRGLAQDSREALKLLKEIADPLPKQRQKQDQDKQGEDKPDQNKQDKKQRTSPTRNSNQSRTERAEAERAARGRPAAGRGPDSASPGAAGEAAEDGKQLQRYLLRSGKVDKDW